MTPNRRVTWQAGVGVLVVHPSVSAKSVPDLIAYAKANPRKINMASSARWQ